MTSTFMFKPRVLHRSLQVFALLFSVCSITAQANSVAATVSPVEQYDVTQSLNLVGKLAASRSVDITSEVTAKVENISVSSNQHVVAGQPLIVLSDDKATASLQEATAYLLNEKRKLSEYERLFSRGAITQTEIEAQKANVDIAIARQSAAKANLRDHQLNAPFSGHIGLVDLNPGEFISVGQPLLTLDDMSEMELDLLIPERYLSQLVVGMGVDVQVQAWGNERFVGTVDAVDTRVNPETLNIKARVKMSNADNKLKPGMLSAATLTFAPEPVAIISVQALEYSGTKRFVYRVVDGKAQRTEVKVGARVDNRVVIESGIEIGETIVVQGLVNMRDGVAIKEVAAESP
jgi:RND family efflux transporter MFP subunit